MTVNLCWSGHDQVGLLRNCKSWCKCTVASWFNHFNSGDQMPELM